MRFTNVVQRAGAGVFLSALLFGADATPCKLGKSLYDDRLAMEKQVQAERPPTLALLAPGTAALAPTSKLTAIDEEYRRFLAALSHVKLSKDATALQACCD